MMEDKKLVDTVISIIIDDPVILKESIETLRQELREKSADVLRLKKENCDLYKKVIDLQTEKSELATASRRNSHDLKRYRKAIIALNRKTRIVPAEKSTEEDDNIAMSEETIEESTQREVTKEKVDTPTAENRMVMPTKSECKYNKKCRYENKGLCKEKYTKCEYKHPVETCQEFSKNGKCQNLLSCPQRHPRGVCHEWKKTGKCKREDTCKFRHPRVQKSHQVHQNPQPTQDHMVPKNHFLGQQTTPTQPCPTVEDQYLNFLHQLQKYHQLFPSWNHLQWQQFQNIRPQNQ